MTATVRHLNSPDKGRGIGRRLRRARRYRELTQQQVADMAHCSLRAYQNWERDSGSPPLDKFLEVAEKLDWPILDLIYGQGGPTPPEEPPEVTERYPNVIPIGSRDRGQKTYAPASAWA